MIGTARAQSAADIQRQVFGAGRQTAPRLVPVPLIFDQREIGLVDARPGSGTEETRLRLASLLDLLRPLLLASYAGELEALPADRGFVALSKLKEAGLDAVYDAQKLQVQVSVPPDRRNVTRLGLGADPKSPPDIHQPAGLSAYTNIRTGLDHVDRADAQPGSGLQPVQVAFENAVNVEGWVLEADGYYRETGPTGWSRGNVRVVHDDVAEAIRYSMGDLSFPIAGFQSFPAMGGIGIAKNFAIQPYRSVQPGGERDFILTAPSTVEVLVNGRPTRSFRLPAGPVSLRDFPGATGTNDVRIRITDDFGRVTEVDFPFFFESRLLAPGLHEFSYNVGITSTSGLRGPVYDEGRPTFSGFHRFGLSDQLTLGANLQGNDQQQLLGGEVLYAGPVGTVAVEPAVSVGTGIGFAAGLRYNFYEPTPVDSSSQRIWSLASTYRSSQFGSLGTSVASNPISLDLSGRVSQSLTADLGAAIGIRHQFSRDPSQSDTNNINLSLRQRIGFGLSADLSFDRNDGLANTPEYVLFGSLRFTFDQGRQSVGSTLGTRYQEKHVTYQYQSGDYNNTLSGSVDLGRRNTDDQITGSAQYRNQRFDLGLRQDYFNPRETGQGVEQRRSSATFGTALVFADGHVAVSRPITDSFAIVVPHPNLEGHKIGLDQFGESYVAESDFFGPPVLPSLVSYEFRSVSIDAPDLPIGYDIGSDRPTMQPGYRSGTLLIAGTDASVLLGGIAHYKDRTPAALKGGEIRALDQDGRAASPFFTNRSGRFRIEGLRPGRYQIILFDEPPATVNVEIPKNASGLLDLGILIFER
jgi:outer membrane usher protein